MHLPAKNLEQPKSVDAASGDNMQFLDESREYPG